MRHHFLLLLSLSLTSRLGSDVSFDHCTEPSKNPGYMIPDDEGINLYFVVQKSENISERNTQLMKKIVDGLVSNLSNFYTVGNKRFYNLDFILFGNSVQVVKVSNDNNDPISIINGYLSANGTQGLGSRTRISDALDALTYFDSKPHVPNLCILLTASPPDDKPLALSSAKGLRDYGVTVVVITIGEDVFAEDVEDIASHKNVVFTAGNCMINETIEETAKNVSDTVITGFRQAHVLPTYEYCHNAFVNIFIIIDVSMNHIEALTQLQKFVAKFNLDRVLMRAMIINSPTSDDWYKQSLHSAVRAAGKAWKLETFDSSYSLPASIRRGRQILLDFPPYHKYIFHEKIVIAATDKHLNALEDVISETSACKTSGIHVLTLAIGANVSKSQLHQIISDPRGIIAVNDYEDINYGLERLNRKICPRVCESGWAHYGEMCYFTDYFEERISWERGQEVCEKRMSKLATIPGLKTSSLLGSILYEDYHYIDVHDSRRAMISMQTGPVGSDCSATIVLRSPKPGVYHCTMTSQPKISLCNWELLIVGQGLKRQSLDTAAISREFRWESGKPFVYTEWELQWQSGFDPLVKQCFVWTPYGLWLDAPCSEEYATIALCEKEPGDIEKEVNKVKILPLWEENACELPKSNISGPFIANGSNCRPVLDVHMNVVLKDLFRCTNGELISHYLICDELEHCTDGSDEVNCSTQCTEYQFNCTNGRCVSLAYFCDFWNDCEDNSDETDCVIAPCYAGQWQCDSGQCIPEYARCDLYYDCYDRSDEALCTEVCKHRRCINDACIPWHWIQDGIDDCGLQEDEKLMTREDRCYTGRYREFFHLFVVPKYASKRPECCMVFDGFGKHFDNYYDSVENCSNNLACPIGFYKCPSSYCIPIEKVCDGVMDCVHGEEELGCGSYICPGYFRCPFATYCHHPARLCDGDADCPGGRDEVMCDFRCPDNCSCFAGVVKCDSFSLKHPKPFDPRTRKLTITKSNIRDVTNMLMYCYFMRDATLISIGLTSLQGILNDLINLRTLNISQNNLSIIPKKSFSKQAYLETLDVSYNPLTEISSQSFSGLKRLKVLIMKHTSLVTLGQYFSLLNNLNVLDIRGNMIHTIPDRTFTGLYRLHSLYLQGNPIINFGQHIYDDLDGLQELYTSIYSLCCPQVRPRDLAKCVSPKLAISSCKDLLANEVLRSSIWLLCIASLFGNLVSLAFRFAWERASMRNGFGVFVTHLGISDFLMGVYLLIIAIADTRFKGTYIWDDYDWRHSAYCKLAGALATISSEASTFFICFITLDRFVVIKFPFSSIRFRYKSALAVLAWITSIAIAAFPLIPSLAHWKFYSKNGACLALPFSTERKPGWIYSTVIFIGVNFLSFIIITLGQISIYRAMKQGSLISSKERSVQDIAVAQRLLLIVVSDFFCWFPVGIMSILALNGTTVSGEAYAWTAVFILPVNSALNPFLYTLTAVVQKMRNAKQSSTGKNTSQSRETSKVVEFGKPGPNMKLLRDVLFKLKTKEDRFRLIVDVLGHLQSGTLSGPVPNTVYVQMRGKVINRICLWTRADISLVDPIIKCAYLSQIKPTGE